MKILKLAILILLIPLWVSAQSLNCPSTLNMRVATSPFKFNNLSKSAQCLTGKKYEFVLTLNQGKDYRLSFFASPIFNNDIKFKVIDLNTNNVVLDLKGQPLETEENVKGVYALKAYFDDKKGKEIHPYFDIFLTSTTQLKIMIDVASLNKKSENVNAYEERKRGCITVFIQDRKAEEVGF